MASDDKAARAESVSATEPAPAWVRRAPTTSCRWYSSENSWNIAWYMLAPYRLVASAPELTCVSSNKENKRGPPYAVGSVPSLSGRAIAYDGVHCRESADIGPVVLKVVPGTGAAFAGITMDELIYASLFPHPQLYSSIGMIWACRWTCAIQREPVGYGRQWTLGNEQWCSTLSLVCS